MNYGSIAFARRGSAAWVTLARPARRNAISAEMIAELRHALVVAQTEDSVRVLVLAGAGKIFCAGADLASTREATIGLLSQGYADVLLLLRRIGKPTIARVHGAALGGGLGLACACDIVLAAPDATLGTPEVDFGLFPMIAMSVLTRHAPRRKVLEMMLTGGGTDGETAVTWGLVTRTVPEEELDTEIDRVVATLASKSPTALRLGLEAYHSQLDLSMPEALTYLQGMFEKLRATEDAREGIAAFLEKRPPVWKGR